MAYTINTNYIDKTDVDHTPFAMTGGYVSTYFVNPIFIQNLGTGCYRFFTQNNRTLAAISGPFWDIAGQTGITIPNYTFDDVDFPIMTCDSGNTESIIYYGRYAGSNNAAYVWPNTTNVAIPNNWVVSFSVILTPLYV